MKMKNFYTIICLVIATVCFSQSKDTEKADKLFNTYEYVDAVKEYLSLVDNGNVDEYVYMQLGTTYYNMFNTTEAAKWYAKAIESKPQNAETYYKYAQMLKANGKYDEANKQMMKFADLAPEDQRAKAFNENPNYIPRLLDKEKLFDVKTAEVSSDKSDFSAVLYDNALFFTSARNNARKNYGWNEEPFLDIYKADYNTDGTITNAAVVTELNSQYHDGPITISSDGNTMYFTSDSFREQSFERDRKNKLKLGRNNLFRATKNGDKWDNIESLPFNSKAYSTSNPSLSRDGKTLYFSSDMIGSIGGVDIWKVSIDNAGTFGNPVNLGSKVNTEGNESFPFIADDNVTLYFASNGKPGLGGLDIFRINLESNAEAINIGKPVNTEKDDFAFTFNDSKNIGFLSSNRNGNDDIFIANAICGVSFQVVVTDAITSRVLSNAKVAILDENKNVIATEMSNANGEVRYRTECNKDYTIQTSKDGYESNVFAILRKSGGEVNAAVQLQPIETIIKDTEISLNTILFEFDQNNITPDGAFELDKLVQVLKKNPKMIIFVKSHTDSRGSNSYNLNLSDARARSTVQYILSKSISKTQITGKGFGESEPKMDCKDNCTEEQHAQNRRSEFIIVK